MAWEGEHCARCGREQRLCWGVTDYFWNKIVPEVYKSRVLCLECFLELAEFCKTPVEATDIAVLIIGKARFREISPKR
jgi:hypothetical protein